MLSRFHGHKTAPQKHLCTASSRCRSQVANQPAALHNDIGLTKRDAGDAPIGEQLKSTDLVNLCPVANPSQDLAHSAGDDQRPRLGIKILGPFKNSDPFTRLTEQMRSEESGRRSAYDTDLGAPASVFVFQTHLASQLIL
ncbi:MAG TPA: hypothetical protein VG206_18930 [Terriglobia bacterium]|nr:hypothetical protein [Terriglobia bacterium]